MATQKSEDEYIEDIVCNETDIGENEMKVFNLKDVGKVLLIKQNGRLHSLGSKCTHYGAPLVNSALGDGRIRCQWHGACFNIQTGDIEDFPGVDSLPCHQVTVVNGKVSVRAKLSELENSNRTKPMCKKLKDTNEHFIIIGGGPAGAVCVETLRQENFSGSITMVCKENHLPYDRVKVSKVGDFDIEHNQFRNPDFYREHDIEVILGVAAIKVDSKAKVVHLENGQNMKFDKLFIATGAQAAVLDVPGKNLKNIITLRNYEDGQYLISQLSPDKNVVINGSSFIAMEAASCCADKVKSVTVVSRSEVPFKQVLGDKVGAAFMKLFKEKGVTFRIKTNIVEVKDDGTGKVGEVQLQTGEKLKADILVLGIGSKFNTEFLLGSGIDLRKDRSIEVDAYLQSNKAEIFAGGDIVHAPVFSSNNEKVTIGHYALAHYHGRIAALNMIGKKQELRVVPFFWTSLFGKSVRYAGNGKFTDVVFVGNVDELKFVAFYIKANGEVIAASSCGMDPVVSQFAELLFQGKKLYKKDLDKDPLDWVKNVLP
ncbi:hypothetical protein WA026_011879 [Henosepilachna vigintioctopunctata]|uniref:Rieske domain-containing protein n=1 Tax=Henosepilachna vigintioctopunctata TaxID=420089 RepID=A0AAW1UKQ2_9CUCU